MWMVMKEFVLMFFFFLGVFPCNMPFKQCPSNSEQWESKQIMMTSAFIPHLASNAVQCLDMCCLVFFSLSILSPSVQPSPWL